MRGVAFLLLAFASFVYATDIHIDKSKLEAALNEKRVSERSRLLEGILNDLIDQLRTLMLNGSDTIPVLDPLSLGTLEVGEEIFGTPGAFIKTGETQIEKLSTFVIDALNIAIEGIIFHRYVLNLDAYIPEVTMDTSSYDMHFNVFGGDIYGTGTMNFRLVRPHLKGRLSTSLSLNNGVFLTINDCEIEVGLGDFQAVITGLWDSEVASLFISRFFSNLLPELMTSFETEINEFLSTTAKDVGNAILKEIDLIDLITP